MRKSLIFGLIINLVSVTSTFGQEPKAVIVGPSYVAAPKQAIILRTLGSTGTTMKFAMSPLVPQSFSFRDALTNELVFLYVPENAGVYSVSLGCSDATGKLDLAILQTIVGGPGPIPGPNPPIPIPIPIPIPNPNPLPIDPLTKIVLDAVATDLAAGVGTAQQKKDLGDIYRAAAKVTVYNTVLTKPQQVYDAMHALAVQKGISDGSLPGLRKALQDFQKTELNFAPGTTLTKEVRDKMANMFNRIADALTIVPAAVPSVNNAISGVRQMTLINNQRRYVHA